jgi:tetratricopeptide (TPR) repeat protein
MFTVKIILCKETEDFKMDKEFKSAEEMKENAKEQIKKLESGINNCMFRENRRNPTEFNILFSRMCRYYKEIAETAFKYEVCYDSVCDYVYFLNDRVSKKKALDVGQRLEQVYNKNEQISLHDKARLWNILGTIAGSIPRMEREADEYFKKAIEAREKLADENPDENLFDLADSYKNASFFSINKKIYDNAELLFSKAIDTYKKAEKIKSDINCLRTFKEELRWSLSLEEISNKDRFSNICEAYEEVMALSFEYKREYDLVRDYICFLNKRGHQQKALEIGRKLEQVYNENEQISLRDKADLWKTLSEVMTSIPGMQAEAEEYYKKATDTWEKELLEEFKDNLPELAKLYSIGCNLYTDIGDTERAENFYRKTIEVYEELVNKGGYTYLPDLATVCYNTCVFYKKQNNLEKLEFYCFKSASVMDKIFYANLNQFLSYFDGDYKFAGILYNKNEKDEIYYNTDDSVIREELAGLNCDIYFPDKHSIDVEDMIYYPQASKKAEKALLAAINFRTKLTELNIDKYLPDIVVNYINAGNFYIWQCDYEKAEQYYMGAIQIREHLITVNRDKYLPDLASSYNHIGNLYKLCDNTEKAEYYYLKTIDLLEELANTDKAEFLPFLAKGYNNAGIFYETQKNAEKAEHYYCKAITAREELIALERDKYLSDIARSYNNIGVFYENKKNSEKAKNYYLKAVSAKEELAKSGEDTDKRSLAVSYYNIATLNIDFNYYKKAYEIAKNYALNIEAEKKAILNGDQYIYDRQCNKIVEEYEYMMLD